MSEAANGASPAVTNCPKCKTAYNTANMVYGQKIKCKHCQTVFEVGRALDLVDQLLEEAINKGASDVHIEPLSDRLRIRYRIDGVLAPQMTIDKGMQPRITSRIKLLSEADISERRMHQDGRFKITLSGNDVDVRMSSYITVHGENIVLRILNKRAGLIPIDQLGFPPKLLKRYVDQALSAASGIVIVTGPTGSGKTSTLYSSIGYCNNETLKISTAEDPVEYQIDGVMQCSINEKIGLTFTETLKALVRQDPDIVVIGEIRDADSAAAAVQIALTGHQVFTTFHTEDSTSAMLRLIDMGIEPYLITSTVTCVLGQRLVRRLCPHCTRAVIPSRRSIDLLNLDPHQVADRKFWKGKGCEHCYQTGYKGRTGLYEGLFLDDVVRQTVLERKPAYEIRNTATRNQNYFTLKEAGIVRAFSGITTLEEVWSNTPRIPFTRSPAELFALTGEEDPQRPLGS